MSLIAHDGCITTFEINLVALSNTAPTKRAPISTHSICRADPVHPGRYLAASFQFQPPQPWRARVDCSAIAVGQELKHVDGVLR